MIDFVSPVYRVRAVPVSKIDANAYNPNVVAPPEMTLLERSIWEDGYTQPVVCTYDPETDRFEIVDGFHRYQVMLTSRRVRAREHGLLPVVLLDKGVADRMASTIRHNRARGTHAVELMTQVVADLVDAGMGDDWIRRHIGVDADELLRLKQISGIAALFADAGFSPAGDPDDRLAGADGGPSAR